MPNVRVHDGLRGELVDIGWPLDFCITVKKNSVSCNKYLGDICFVIIVHTLQTKLKYYLFCALILLMSSQTQS